MSNVGVYAKLMQARVKLAKMNLKKTGVNKFAGYKYFELSDFLPPAMEIFRELGLASYISFDHDKATMVIVDLDDKSTLAITSPMAEAALKGAHAIQNLGAVQTYLRRYLWVTALEITESDQIDSSPSDVKSEEKPVDRPADKPPAKPPQKVVGEAGQFQITVTTQPGADMKQWLDLVKDAAEVCLSLAESEDDVMQIFRKNKQLFDTVKAKDAVFFKELMDTFGKIRTELKGKA